MQDENVWNSARDKFASMFYIPAMWRVTQAWVFERFWKQKKSRAPFWSSTAMNSTWALWFEVKFEGGIFNIWWWSDHLPQGKPVRCFKDMEDRTVTWKDGENTLETDLYVYDWAIPSYNSHEGWIPTKAWFEF